MKKSLFGLVGAFLAVVLITRFALTQAPGKAPAPKDPPKSAPKETVLLDDVPVNQVKEFMRAKLDHSQKVLEGLAVEDYALIAKHSQELSLLSLAAGWQVIQTPTYSEHSTDFRRTVDTMTEAGKNKNLDGATLAYVEMTMKCVACHKYVRKIRTARSDSPPPRGATTLR